MTAEFKNTSYDSIFPAMNMVHILRLTVGLQRQGKPKINICHNIFSTAASLNIFHCFIKYFYLVPVRLSARWSALVIMVCMLARWAEQLGGGASPGAMDRRTLRAPGPSHTTLGGGLKISTRLFCKKHFLFCQKNYLIYIISFTFRLPSIDFSCNKSPGISISMLNMMTCSFSYMN